MKWKAVCFSFALVVVPWLNLLGQDGQGPIVFGAGYEFQIPVYLAPGQLVTLFAHGVPPALTRAPSGVDLPTSLGRVSAGMQQLASGQILFWKLPILEVRWFHTCRALGVFACYTPTAAVTVQIPFEMQSPYDNCNACFQPDVGVSVDGEGDIPTEVIPLSDKIHILRTFDSVMPVMKLESAAQCSPLINLMNTAPFNPTGLPCPAIVKHNDDSLVTAKNPAKPGEELVAYAVGLGRTFPPSMTGQLVRSSSPTVTTFALDFNYKRNALSSRPPPIDSTDDGAVSQPLYTGTAVGFVGLYEIRFQVPPVPPGTPPCTDVVPRFQFENIVYSNLTVSVGGRTSFDGAGICVAVDLPAAAEGRKGKSK